MINEIRVLALEDSATDAELNLRELRRAGYQAEWRRVQHEAEFAEALQASSWDVILADFGLPGWDSVAALALLQSRGLEIPFIIVSGTIGEEQAVAAMRNGAADYLLKDRLTRLGPAVKRALETKRLRDEKRLLEAERAAERQRAEEALRDSEQLYRSLVESLPQSIFRKDAAGLFTFASHRFCLGLGRPPAEVLGRSDADFFPPELAAQYRADDQRVMATGEPFEAEEQHRDAAGRIRHVHVSKSALLNAAGQAIGVQGVFLDITEKKELAAQFLRAQRLESLGALAGGIAHDLNNALAPILMASEFLKLTCKDPESGRLLDTIFDSAQRGAGMVRQILTFSRGSEVQRALVQPRHLIRDMIDIARHTFPKRIEIRTDFAADVWPLRGNPTQLHQILLNLCINARDAMPEGGTLTLAATNVRLDAACTMLSPAAKPGPHTVLTVADTGTGMTPEVRARMFEAFFTTKEPGKGTGLGLATVHTLVKEHGGFLTVDSTVGRGTTFRIYLPAEAASAADAVAPAPPALPPGNGELILVVDDEAGVLRIAEQTLLAFGYRVVVANDGTQAMGVAAQHRDTLRLLLTDMAMPYMDGKATTRAMRQLLPQLPVIVASGADAMVADSLRKELDIQAFLAKPYSADRLLRTVHEVLHGKDPS